MQELPKDEEIAAKVQKGDVQSFGLLMERYQERLVRYARKFLFDTDDGQDLVQEVFLKAYANIQSFDASRNFSSWVYRIAHNEFVNALKKKGRQPLPFFDPDTIFPHPVARENAEDSLASKEMRLAVEECLGQLPLKYREPLILFFFEDMDYKQISEIMHIPVSTVGVRIARGKRALRDIYNKLHEREN